MILQFLVDSIYLMLQYSLSVFFVLFLVGLVFKILKP
jgi:hypothetical protein